MSDLALLAALNNTGLVGTTTYQKIVSHLKNIENIKHVKEKDLMQIEGIGEKVSKAIIKNIKDMTGEREIEYAQKHNIKMLSFLDNHFPKILKTIYDPPLIIYVKGKLPKDDTLSIAIVGSRDCSDYGRKIAQTFAKELARIGTCIVSGLARGIDTCAHLGTLKIKDAKTIAVLGSGLLKIYPPENKKLADTISQNGALVSEFSLNTTPEPENFPRRNRIISGLSLGVIVIEAGIKSGALITANWAIEQNREVFCVPGKIDSPKNKGCHLLIKQGAKLVEDIYDVLEEIPQFEPILKKILSKQTLSPLQKTILRHIINTPLTLEELCIKTKLPNPLVEEILSQLISKQIVTSKDNRFIKSPPNLYHNINKTT
jgi:DNA processing protein